MATSSLLVVKYGSRSMSISKEGKFTVGDVMEEVEKLTNIHKRGQKIIYKGKVLMPEDPLTDLTNGAKLMLMATSGVHQGSIPHKSTSIVSNGTKTPTTKAVSSESRPLNENLRMLAWKKTGQASLRDLSLLAIPESVWECNRLLKVLDAEGNQISSFPMAAAALTNLQRLNLSNNCLREGSIQWDVFSHMNRLQCLEIKSNRLTTLPQSLFKVTTLKKLDLSWNKIESLPSEIGQLSSLEWLDASNNSLKQIPDSIGSCLSLIEAQFSSNFIKEVPKSMGDLKEIKVMCLNNNGIKAFPPEVLKGCSQLTTLSLLGNPMTMEELREVDGWEEHDRRRRDKYNKQIDFQAMGSSAGFEEGADETKWRHW